MTNPIQYANYNFEDAVLQLQNWLKSKNSWKDAYRSGTGQMMAEFYGALANLVMYYQERAVQEMYLPTARNKSSVVNLVALLGYVPKRVISAYTPDPTLAYPVNATITFSIQTALGDGVTLVIPKYTKLSTTEGIPFLTRTPVVFTGATTSISGDVIQGQYQQLQVTSDGSVNQEYQLKFTNIENTSLEVRVDGVLWTAKTSFILGTPASQWYKVIPNFDDTITVSFGDNIYAKAPDPQSEIVISFILSDGLAGNVYATDSITTVVTQPWFDSAGNRVQLSVTNTDIVLGGADAEGIEEIRSEAPKVFQTGDRAVTRDDFKAILLNSPVVDIASANAWGENEELLFGGAANYDMFNRVKLCILLQEWNLLSDSMKETLSQYLYGKSMITVKYTYVTPDIVEVIPTLDLKITKGYTLSTVNDAVLAAIADQFVLGTTTVLGTPKRIGDLVAIIEAVPGVSYSHTQLLIYREMDRISAGVYNVSLPLLTVAYRGVSIYAAIGGGVDTLIATDDGAGNITPIAGNVVTGTVDYATGVVDVTVTVPVVGVADVVSVRYLQDQGGDVVVGQNQAAKHRLTNITSYTYE